MGNSEPFYSPLDMPVKARTHKLVPSGTRVRFRNFETLPAELRGVPGVIVGHQMYGGGHRYVVDVGPGWGDEGMIRRTDFVVLP